MKRHARERWILAALIGLLHAALIAAATAPPPTGGSSTAGAAGAAGALPVRLLAPLQIRAAAPAMADLSGLARAVAVLPEQVLAALPPASDPVPSPASVYLPTQALERHPAPVSAPDLSSLTIPPESLLPVHLRLYIDRFGSVVDVVTLDAGDSAPDFLSELTAIFRGTGFVPGQRNGRDVPSYMDIEVLAQ